MAVPKKRSGAPTTPRIELPRNGWLPTLKYVQVATHSRCNANCVFPLSGDTKVITPTGERPISELVGDCTLLVPSLNNGGAGGSGVWQEATVRSYGVQPLRTVTLTRGKVTKDVRATPEHRWIVKKHNRVSGPAKQRMVVATQDLKIGDVIPSCNMANYKTTAHEIPLSVVGVAQGFTFGDGSHSKSLKRNSPTTTRLYGEKDLSLLPYFAAYRRQDVVANGVSVPEFCDLPRYWKSLPPLEECKSFLLGWLAGYFAADGTINKVGTQAVIHSAKLEHLEHVKAICVRLGIKTNPVTTKSREGFGKVSNLYSISLRVSDLDSKFFICEEHKRRFNSRNENDKEYVWRVAAVTDHNEQEEVFCATVLGVACFALADNVVTGNCPYIESKHAAMPGMMTDATWHRILSNLVPWKDSLVKFCPYFMQEPLIDKSIFEKIDDIYRVFPNICAEISTNGAALTDAAIEKLLTRFAGRKHDLWVSHHGIDAQTLEHIMAIDYEKATGNLIRLLKAADGKFNIRIRGAGESSAIAKVYFTREQYLAHWEELFNAHGINRKGVQVDSFRFHDRAGTLHRTERDACNLNGGKVREIGPGHAPFYCPRINDWVHFMYDGSLRICCMDYHHEVKLPNINEMSLLTYFHSDEYAELAGKVSGKIASEENFICKRCVSPGG